MCRDIVDLDDFVVTEGTFEVELSSPFSLVATAVVVRDTVSYTADSGPALDVYVYMPTEGVLKRVALRGSFKSFHVNLVRRIGEAPSIIPTSRGVSILHRFPECSF